MTRTQLKDRFWALQEPTIEALTKSIDTLLDRLSYIDLNQLVSTMNNDNDNTVEPGNYL